MSRSMPKAKLVEDLVRKTRFKKDAVESLLKIFSEHATAIKNIDRQRVEKTTFHDMLQNDFGLTDSTMMDRVFRAFDTDSDGSISEEEWVIGFSVFLSKDLDEKKMKFIFRVYDVKDEGLMTRESMFYFLKNCLIKTPTEEDPDEGPKDLVEIALKKLDMDKDQKVSFQDFQNSLMEEPLLRECLGPCLPRDEYIDKFCCMLSGDKVPWSSPRKY